MLIDHWPLVGLRLSTPRLELRLPSEDELAELGELAAEGIHEPDRMPFLVPWTDLPPGDRARSVVQHHWLRRGNWSPENWALNLVVFAHDQVVGLQTIAARDFAMLREVSTASWLGARFQRQGIGTEMRAAVLHLAFAGLNALEAMSGAFEDNASSFTVSMKHGYELDGVERHVVRGQPAVMRRLRLTRARWEMHQHVPVSIVGLSSCLPMFGLSDDSRAGLQEATRRPGGVLSSATTRSRPGEP